MLRDPRWRLVGMSALLLFAVALAVTSLSLSFVPVVHVTGTVIEVDGDECVISYEDAEGRTRQYSDFGGKYGCDDEVGDRVDLYYEPGNLSSIDTLSPWESRLLGLAAAGFATVAAFDVHGRIRRGDWSRRRPTRRRTGSARRARHRR